MSNRIELELIFVHETADAILIKGDEDTSAEYIAKVHVDYDDTFLVPGMVSVFEVDESIAFEVGLI